MNVVIIIILFFIIVALFFYIIIIYFSMVGTTTAMVLERGQARSRSLPTKLPAHVFFNLLQASQLNQSSIYFENKRPQCAQ